MTSAGYAAPLSVADAVALLAGNGSARVIAGGSGLLTGASRAQAASALLVDLRKIPGLTAIEPAQGGLRLGAMVTLNTVAFDAAVRRTYPTLASSVVLTGDAQMRNRATIGGSLASPNASDTDLAAVLIALGATATVVGAKGERSVAVDTLLAAPRGREEVITAVTIPAPAARSATAYESQRHPATLTPLCGVAAFVSLAADGTVASSRVALVGASATPVRLTGVEQALQGKAPTDAAAVNAAAAAAGQGLSARGDLHASPEYRTHLARVLTARAVRKAVAAIGG